MYKRQRQASAVAHPFRHHVPERVVVEHLDRGLDADLLKVALQPFAVAFGVDVRAGAHSPVHARGEAVGISGLGEQFLGALGIIVAILVVGVVARSAEMQDAVGRPCQALALVLGHVVAVDGHAHGLAHPHVLEMRILEVDPHDVDRRTFAAENLHPLLLEEVERVRGRRADKIDFATDQRQFARRHFGNSAQDDLVGLRLARFIPVVLVAGDNHLFTNDAFDELERTGADRMVLDVLVAIGLDGSRADHARRARSSRDHAAQELGIGLLQIDPEGEFVDHLVTGKILPHPSHQARRKRLEEFKILVGHPVHVELGGLGVPGRSVMEFDVVAEMERVGFSVGGNVPAFGERRHDLGSVRTALGEILLHERLEDMPHDIERIPGPRGMRVQSAEIGFDSHYDGIAGRCRRADTCRDPNACRQQRQRGPSQRIAQMCAKFPGETHAIHFNSPFLIDVFTRSAQAPP